MEIENCDNNLLLNKEIGKKKKSVGNNILEDSNKKSFGNMLNEMVKGEKKQLRSITDKIGNNKVGCEKGFIEIKEDTTISGRVSQDRIDGVMSRLAGFFRIGVNLMTAMLQSLGINPEDLVDESKRDNIIEKLAEHFGLNKDKQEELYKLLINC